MAFYQDWRLICPSDKEEKAVCGMSSDVADPRTGTKLAQLSMGTQPNKTSEEMVVSVPLTVLIQPGIGLQVGNDTKTYPYMTCIASCSARSTRLRRWRWSSPRRTAEPSAFRCR
jgi:invasion protein IalB